MHKVHYCRRVKLIGFDKLDPHVIRWGSQRGICWRQTSSLELRQKTALGRYNLGHLRFLSKDKKTDDTGWRKLMPLDLLIELSSNAKSYEVALKLSLWLRVKGKRENLSEPGEAVLRKLDVRLKSDILVALHIFSISGAQCSTNTLQLSDAVSFKYGGYHIA
jgi:hypothetical protein